MPVEFGLWRLEEEGVPRSLPSSTMPTESHLEALLEKDISILGLDILVMGRQVLTGYGKRIDLLAVDGEGDLYVIELKRDRTPREVVAQTLDYGLWVKELTYQEIADSFHEYKGLAFEEAFFDRFGVAPPEALNQRHRLVIVASELDASTERIVTYLASEHGVPLNVLFFRYFIDDGRQYLARTWLIEPTLAEAHARGSAGKGKEPWNGQDFYVSVGEGPHRSWEDFRRFGFVSGGGGQWYSRTLDALKPGHRVFACIPGTGYVGVGTVKDTSRPVREFMVPQDGAEIPILQAPLDAKGMGEYAADPERAEHLVRVEWLKTLPKENAIWEKGMFANQNTACALRNRFTLERLVQGFGLEA